MGVGGWETEDKRIPFCHQLPSFPLLNSTLPSLFFSTLLSLNIIFFSKVRRRGFYIPVTKLLPGPSPLPLFFAYSFFTFTFPRLLSPSFLFRPSLSSSLYTFFRLIFFLSPLLSLCSLTLFLSLPVFLFLFFIPFSSSFRQFLLSSLTQLISSFHFLFLLSQVSTSFAVFINSKVGSLYPNPEITVFSKRLSLPSLKDYLWEEQKIIFEKNKRLSLKILKSHIFAV